MENLITSRRKFLGWAVATSATTLPLVDLMPINAAQAQSAPQFNTIINLLTTPSSGFADQEIATVANYATSTDDGGGTFVWDINSKAANDFGIVFCPTDRLAAVGNVFLHTGNGVSTGYGQKFAHVPVQPGTVAIYAGSVVARDNGAGTLFGPGVYGTINYTTGAWTLIYTVAPSASVSLTTNYQYAALAGRWIRQVSSTMNLDAFGPRGFAAWSTAFSSAAGNAFSVLEVSANTYTIKRAPFAGIGTLLMVPNGLTIQLDAGAQVNFDYIETPLFCFWNNTSGGMTGGTFRYTGGTPNYLSPSVSKTQLSSTIGLLAAGLSTGQLCDMYALVYSNSSNMVFSGWDVASANPNSETYIIPTIIYMHPTTGSVPATNNNVSNMTWRDFQQGWLGYGQSGLTVNGLNSDRRSGLHLVQNNAAYGPGPGHLIYTNDTTNLGGLLMTGCTFENIFDGPNPINYPASCLYNAHTLSPKSVGDGCVFNGVVSQHPVGFWSGSAVQGSTIENFTWETSDATYFPYINYGFAIASNSQIKAGYNNVFSNFTVNVPHKPFQLAADAGVQFNNNTISNFNVTCNNSILTSAGVLDFAGNDNTLTNVYITPTVSDGYKGMCAFCLRGSSSTGNTGTIRILGANVGAQIMRFAPSSNPALYPNSVNVTT